MKSLAARLSLPIVALLLTSSCITTLEEGMSTTGTLTRDCLIPTPDQIASLGEPVALEFPTSTLWIWELLEKDDNTLISNASARITSASSVCADGPTLAQNPEGELIQLLQLTPEENTSNANRDDGRNLHLRPTGGFVHEGKGYLYYEHLLQGPDFFDVENLGAGLCILEEDADVCQRVSNNENTILWTPDQHLLNRGGLVVEDRAILYGCRNVANFTTFCTVSGVPLADILNPDAYQHWNIFSEWVDDLTNASVISEEPGSITVSPFHNGYLLTTLDLFDGAVSARYSTSPKEAFDHPLPLFHIAPPESAFAGRGHEHSGLRRDPLAIHMTYFSDNRAASGLHLATFVLHGTGALQ